MSIPEPAPPKRQRWGRSLAYAAGATFVVGGGAIALGPAAPMVIDHFADGQRVWRLGRISVEGVSGGWLGNLRAERVTLEDDEGVWLDANDVALEWRPQDLLFGGVRLDAARIARLSIARQPILSERRPSSDTRFHVQLDALNVGDIDLGETVLGQAARFNLALALDLDRTDLQLLDLNLRRIDSDADRAVVLYRPDGDYALNVDIVGAPGGVIARALGVSERGVRASAQGRGDQQTGEANYDAFVGDGQLLRGTASWTPATWRLDGGADLQQIPAFSTLAERIGARVSLSAQGERVGDFTARAETSFFAVDLAGRLNEARALDGPARIVATTARLSDIARESPFELGAARFEGELAHARGTTAIRGNFDAQEIDALGRRVRLTGPLDAALTPDAFTLNTDLRAPDNAPPLFAQARLETALRYDRREQRFALTRATLEGQALALDAQGWSRGAEGEFSGDWRVRQLQALAGDLRGGASGQWRAFTDARIWTVTVRGAGEGVAGSPDIIPQLVGATPRLDAMLRSENGGLTVSHARIDGARLRAAARGRIVRGAADLALEASARGPLSLGGAEIAGVIDATGRITGSIARPTLTAEASMSSFNASGAVVVEPRIRLTLAPAARGYSGRAEVTGQVSDQPLTAQSNLSLNDGAVSLSELDAQLGALAAQGSATVTARGVTATLDVNGALNGLIPGVSGRFAGDLSLTPETLTLDANIADARAGELRVRAATLRATGPLNAIDATFDMRGRLRNASLAFAGTGALDLENANARIEGRGTLAEAPIFTRAPITLAWGDGAIEATINVAMDDGVVQAQWRERRRALSGAVQIEDAPIAPLAAIFGERATGRIDGQASLINNGRGLSGEADLVLEQARFAGRQRGTLDMRINATLEPSRLRTRVEATSTEGLAARFEADAPVETSNAPIRIALARERRGAATWSVRGPAESLWAAARLPDQSLAGQLDGEGELQFGAGYLSGAGHIEIVDGRFEDKLTGVTLVDLDARVAIGDAGVRIERFTASGPRGGRIVATGGSTDQRNGEISVTLTDMRVADRPDARARASGELTLAWEGLRSRLTGDLNILEADIDIAASPDAGIATLDVIEINRPGDEDEPETEESAAPRRNGSTDIDVRVRAPGRVFTRGRGVDAEWALDLRLDGTASHPAVFGTARAIRGTLALSGQPFTIEDARITFNGDPLDADIDMTAVRDSADLTARIRLTGTAREPEIAFSSDPALPEDEILPQILFGRSVEDLSPFEAAQLAASLAALSGTASLDIMDAARSAAGLDRFNVRQDEDGGFLVAGGVYLTRDVYLEVARTGLGQAQTRVEWTVRPRLVLITSFLGNGDQAVSLRWRRESD